VSPRSSVSRRELARFATIGAVSVAVACAGGAWAHLVVAETAQAHAFVDEGGRALARNDRGAAVLSFERARSRAPRAGFVRAPIEATGATDVEPLVARVLRLVTSAEWLSIAAACALVCGATLALDILRRQSSRTKRGRWIALAAAISLVVALAGLMESNAYPLAVVTSGDAPVRVAPYSSAVGEASLPGGAIVVVGQAFGGFRRVLAADGVTGWVSQRSLESVVGPDG